MHSAHGSEHTYDHSVYQNDGKQHATMSAWCAFLLIGIFAAEYFTDVVKAFREEIQDLYDHGCRRIQFDDPSFCFLCHDAMISAMEASGVDHKKLLTAHINVYNAVTAGRPHDLIIGVHSCRGNMKVRVRLDYDIARSHNNLLVIGHALC